MSVADDKPVTMTAAEARALGYTFAVGLPDTVKVSCPNKPFVHTDAPAPNPPSFKTQTASDAKAAGIEINSAVPDTMQVITPVAVEPVTPSPDPI